MALHFDGSTGTVTHGNIAALEETSAGTWMFWFNIDSVKSQTWCAKGTGAAGNGWAIQSGTLSNDDIGWISNNQQGNILAATAAADIGAWQHAAFVFDGSLSGNANRLKGWLDGVAQTLTFSGTIPATTVASSGGNQVVAIGANSSGATFVDGLMAFVRIWSAALTEAEVQQERWSYRPVRTANLVLSTPYDDGTSAKDYSGNGNHGSVTGATQESGPPVSFGAAVLVE